QKKKTLLSSYNKQHEQRICLYSNETTNNPPDYRQRRNTFAKKQMHKTNEGENLSAIKKTYLRTAVKKCKKLTKNKIENKPNVKQECLNKESVHCRMTDYLIYRNKGE
uniref:Uncharacterized protein n=1 Tax=Parascaris univalens TaxID=6257 RepID=A0A915CF13_PARUN